MRSDSFSFRTRELTRGAYSASVTVSDPNAIDAPQFVAVVIQVGSNGASSVEQTLNPGQSAQVAIDSAFCLFLQNCTTWQAVSEDGGIWMSVAVSRMGTIPADGPVYVRLAPTQATAIGRHSGNVVISGGRDPRTVPVTLTVTYGPIASPSVQSLHLRIPATGHAGVNGDLPPIQLKNTGLGELIVTGADAIGDGISAVNHGGDVKVRIRPEGLMPGSHEGIVRIGCNAANCPVAIPVRFDVIPLSAPTTCFQGSRPSFPYGLQLTAAPGDILTIFGELFTTQRTRVGSSLPLPDLLGDAQVLVNNRPAKLLGLSSGRAQLQISWSEPAGQGEIQVVRRGVPGNRVSVGVAPQWPLITRMFDETGLTIDATHAAKSGSIINFDVTGLGGTNPPIADGMPGPATPLAVPKANTVLNCYVSPSPIQVALNAYLIPGQFGLFRASGRLPAAIGSGWVGVQVKAGDAASNIVLIYVVP